MRTTTSLLTLTFVSSRFSWTIGEAGQFDLNNSSHFKSDVRSQRQTRRMKYYDNGKTSRRRQRQNPCLRNGGGPRDPGFRRFRNLRPRRGQNLQLTFQQQCDNLRPLLEIQLRQELLDLREVGEAADRHMVEGVHLLVEVNISGKVDPSR